MSILITLGLTVRGAMVLVVLFAAQFVTSITASAETNRGVSIALSALYLLLAVAQFVRHRRALSRTACDGVVTPFGVLERADAEAASR